MDEKTRQRVLKNQQNCENTIERKKEILNEINELVEELNKSEIVLKLKDLGTEYLEKDNLQQNLEKQHVRELQRIKDFCIHPVLVITGYKKHYNNRVISVKTKEEAEYASVRCLECGKLTYTKDKDENENWDSYILKPTSVGQVDVDYVKRVIFELPLNVKFKDLHDYYQEIMLDAPQKEIIKKVLMKVKENK